MLWYLCLFRQTTNKPQNLIKMCTETCRSVQHVSFCLPITLTFVVVLTSSCPATSHEKTPASSSVEFWMVTACCIPMILIWILPSFFLRTSPFFFHITSLSLFSSQVIYRGWPLIADVSSPSSLIHFTGSSLTWQNSRDITHYLRGFQWLHFAHLRTAKTLLYLQR